MSKRIFNLLNFFRDLSFFSSNSNICLLISVLLSQLLLVFCHLILLNVNIPSLSFTLDKFIESSILVDQCMRSSTYLIWRLACRTFSELRDDCNLSFVFQVNHDFAVFDFLHDKRFKVLVQQGIDY